MTKVTIQSSDQPLWRVIKTNNTITKVLNKHMMKKILLFLGLALMTSPLWSFGIGYKANKKMMPPNSHYGTMVNCGFSSNTISNVQFGTSRSDAIRINTFTALTGSPTGYIIAINTTNSFTPITNNAVLPTANRTYSGSGQQVVHIGTTTNPNVIVNGLTSNTEYFFKVYAYFDNCGSTGSQISYQQVGYSTSNYTSGGSRTPLSITYTGGTSAIAGSSTISLAASSANSTGFLYQLIQTTNGTSIINNAGVYTLQPGEAGTVVVDIKAEASGSATHSPIHQTVTITISKTNSTLNVSTPTYTINDGTTTIDLAALTTTNSAGTITYSILTRVEDRLGSYLTPNSTLNVSNIAGSIALKASLAATGYHTAKEVIFIAIFASDVGTPITPAITFDNFSMPINSNQTLNAITPSGVSVNYSLVSNPTGAQIAGTNLFSGQGVPSGGLPRTVIVKATTVATSSYVSATKNIEVNVTQATPTITFPTLSGKNTNDPPFDLSASSDAVTIIVLVPNAITYTSSNTAVVTISGSTATIVGVGTSTITASQTGNSHYTDAATVSHTLTVTDSSIANETVSVSPSTVGNCITSADATVTLGSSQVNVQYTLRDNSDNSVIGSPIAGTGSSISFPAETLTANKTYNVLAQEVNGSKTLVLSTKPSVTFNANIQNQQVVLSQLNANTARISLSDSESGISYYLRDNSNNSILQSMNGTGNSITFADQNFTGVTTYNVLAVKTSALNGQRNVLQLDGVNDFVKSGVKTLGHAVLGMTLDTWVNIPSSDDTDQNTTIIGTLLLGGNPDEEFRGANGESHNLYVKINNGMMYAGSTDDHVTFHNTTPVAYPKDQWIHIAGVRNSNSIRLYINGTQVGIVNSVPAIPNPSADGMSVGAESNGFNAVQVPLNSSNVLGGALVNSRFWYAALNASQVATSMTANNVATTGFAETLAIGYSLSQTSGLGITNVSGNANFNGTLNNGIGDATNWVQDYLFLDVGSCGQFQLGNTVTTDPAKTTQNITFNAISNRTYGDATFNLSASSDSGLTAFTYSSSNTDVATISGSTVTILGAGSTVITVNQAGNATYAAATATQTFTVDPRGITVTTQDQAVSLNGALPTLTASITSGSLLTGQEIFIPIDPPAVNAAGNQTISVSTTLRADSTFDPNGLCTAGACILNTAKDTNLTANYAITNNNTGVLIVSDPNVGVVWDGSTGVNWNDGTNWSGNAVPNNIDITIPQTANMPNVGAGVNGVVNEMLVQSSTLTIPDNSSIIVRGNLTNQGTITVNSQGSTSGVLLVEGNPTGTVTYVRGGFQERDPADTNADTNLRWSIVSPPVVGQKIKDFVENAANDVAKNVAGTLWAVGYYDGNLPPTGQWVYYTVAELMPGGAHENTTFQIGTSYAIARNTAGSVTFTGTLEVNTVNKTVTSSQWNAIGNPYTAFIPATTTGGDVNNFLSDNAGKFDAIRTGVYVWDNQQKQYVGYNLTSATSFTPGQGFLVKTSAIGTSMAFNGTRRSIQPGSGNTGFNRSAEAPSIQLKAKRNDLTIDTFIKYFDNTTKALDAGYDLADYKDDEFDLYTKLLEEHQDVNFSIQSLPNSDHEQMEITVGLHGKAGDIITLSAEVLNMPNGMEVILEDRALGTFTNLSDIGSKYTITLEQDIQGTGRFYLQTQSSTLSSDDNPELSGVKIFMPDTNILRITGLQEHAAVKLYNILGAEVLATSFEGTLSNDISLPKLRSGIYIVSLQTISGRFNKKIVIENN